MATIAFLNVYRPVVLGAPILKGVASVLEVWGKLGPWGEPHPGKPILLRRFGGGGLSPPPLTPVVKEPLEKGFQ